MNTIDELNEREENMMPAPDLVDGYHVRHEDGEYVIDLFQGTNVLKTIGGYPTAHVKPEAAHAHARRLGYRQM